MMRPERRIRHGGRKNRHGGRQHLVFGLRRGETKNAAFGPSWRARFPEHDRWPGAALGGPAGIFLRSARMRKQRPGGSGRLLFRGPLRLGTGGGAGGPGAYGDVSDGVFMGLRPGLCLPAGRRPGGRERPHAVRPLPVHPGLGRRPAAEYRPDAAGNPEGDRSRRGRGGLWGGLSGRDDGVLRKACLPPVAVAGLAAGRLSPAEHGCLPDDVGPQ